MKAYHVIGLNKKYGLIVKCTDEQWEMFSKFGVNNNTKDGVLNLPNLIKWCVRHGIGSVVLRWRASLLGQRELSKINSFAKKNDMLITRDVKNYVIDRVCETGDSIVEITD